MPATPGAKPETPIPDKLDTHAAGSFANEDVQFDGPGNTIAINRAGGTYERLTAAEKSAEFTGDGD